MNGEGVMAGDGFPDVVWIPAHADRHAVRRSRQIDAVVLHVTDGKAVDARQTARNVFGSPKQLGADGKWRAQSAHYVVGRDGTVVQCVLHKDIAFHANKENSYTIGIEHNARDGADTTLTDIQYWNSAKLVLWIGRQLGLPVTDRWYLQGHSEIDPATTHSNCPQRALNWRTYMHAMADVQAIQEGRRPSMRLWDI
jgi:N-acetyl-anhydromuramyl-L-alanine amidase AmpD